MQVYHSGRRRSNKRRNKNQPERFFFTLTEFSAILASNPIIFRQNPEIVGKSIRRRKVMIEVKNLTKYYKGSLGAAVKNASLTAMPGEITVLLGPNGAGKSTTIKSIVNLLSYNGEILICGYPNNSLEAKKQFGYIPEVPVLYDLLTVDESIEFIGKAYRLENYKETGNKYLELFQLTQQRHKLAKELSKGMKQKLSMILALLIGLGSVALGACNRDGGVTIDTSKTQLYVSYYNGGYGNEWLYS